MIAPKKKVMTVINSSSLGIPTDFVVAIPDEDRSNLKSTIYNLFDIYNPPALGNKLNVSLLGFWSNLNKITITFTQDKLQRRSNLFRLKTKAAFLVNNLYPIFIKI